VANLDSKQIARQWNREIEDEIRRVAAARRDEGPWRTLVWAALWFLWLVALVGILGLLHLLH